ncbi:MAG: hypothetical protein RBR10_10645, partial [Bacteroidales bacterium]|nr:hypothetical protein [Bacteroidales bacterium]
ISSESNVTSKPKKTKPKNNNEIFAAWENRNANAQNSTSCKTHKPAHGTIFAARAVFLLAHNENTNHTD